jgi:uncharacterized protein YceK
MKLIIVVLFSLLLAGCGTPLTRLLPKLEKIELPEELMVPPKDCSTNQYTTSGANKRCPTSVILDSHISNI